MHANFRRDFFFWLGVLILPVFWSWFTLGPKHSKLSRGLAFGWLAGFTVVVVLTWPEMVGHYQFALANLQFISIAVGGGLFAWLVLRHIYHTGCPSFIDIVVFCWVVAVFTGSPASEQALENFCQQPLGFAHAMAILVPALLHFTLAPVQRELGDSA
ncbi:hypothetical protein DES53_102538 [Roseimicrobium gellanilyticum]|uniref:Uncharacterized protein n=1 Tax=Roseimicrobium gellanilyticum TaxID=748857 RepID=A0A366HR74_9BACT|nr:hypothetical protein [Roseimicrobium gellanilyticum]RBP46152.1 hypothetical protein DES53_102538 [Roseimicrobium gellanilyticum]